MTKVKIEGNEYIANISGVMNDSSWDNRESKTIEFYQILSAEEVASLFHEGCSWSIVYEYNAEEVDPETGETKTVVKREEYDNSDFSMAGAVTDYRTGIVSVKMGKLTEMESLIEDMFGGID